MPDAKYWGVVPAAGQSRRMPDVASKQQAQIAGASVLEHSVRPLLACGRLEGLVIAVRPGGDPTTDALCKNPSVRSVAGGETRAHSVMAALDALASDADTNDWALVHDGVRPCLSDADLSKLIDELGDDPVGGLLAAPLDDTVKMRDADRVKRTVRRDELVRALTPQMFRFGLLRDALRGALRDHTHASDEAEAMETAGHTVRLVMGSAANMKVTRPGDLAIAEAILSSREGATQ